MDDAWRLALLLGEAPTVWSNYPRVTITPFMVVNARGKREVGNYEINVKMFGVAKDGHIVPYERIWVHLRPNERRDTHEVLVHEMLHAVWQRKYISLKRFGKAFPDSEEWVALTMEAYYDAH